MHISPDPRTLGLPHATWRTGQRRAIRQALFAPTPHVVIQAPTGSGKSTIVAGASRLLRGRSVTLTATKPLMQQYAQAFPHLFPIMGMGNYICDAAGEEFLSWFPLQRPDRPVMADRGPCRSGASCSLKDNGCAYFDRVRGALAHQSVLTNYSYWFAMRMYGRGLGPVHTAFADEAHALPEELMSAAGFEIPAYLLERVGGWPYPYGQPLAIAAAAAQWVAWAARKLEDLKPTVGTEQADLRPRKTQLVETLERLARLDAATWAWDRVGDRWVFEPVVPQLLLGALATPTTVQRVCYLSATVTPHTLTMLGIPSEAVTFVSLPSRFPVARRPLYIIPSTRVDHRMSDTAKTYWISRIDAIIRGRQDRKGIIHTVSYARAQEILTASRFRGIMLAPRGAAELPAAIDRFRRATPPMILLSPSVTTGYDFPYRDAEYQILAKLPFPDTRNNIAKARMAATEGYRDHLTTQTLVQMYGRVVRADDDQGETFIVDDHAQWYLPKFREWLPAHVAEAIAWPSVIPTPPPPLT